MKKKEVWKDIPNYKGRYQASSFGNIRSLNYEGRPGKVQILKPTNYKGYLAVGICEPKAHKTVSLKYVHRLIAITFIPNPSNYKEINHIDENKANNCVENLEWCSRAYNVRYSKYKVYKAVKVIKNNYEIVYPSITDAAKALNTKPGIIHNVINRSKSNIYKKVYKISYA